MTSFVQKLGSKAFPEEPPTHLFSTELVYQKIKPDLFIFEEWPGSVL